MAQGTIEYLVIFVSGGGSWWTETVLQQIVVKWLLDILIATESGPLFYIIDLTVNFLTHLCRHMPNTAMNITQCKPFEIDNT